MDPEAGKPSATPRSLRWALSLVLLSVFMLFGSLVYKVRRADGLVLRMSRTRCAENNDALCKPVLAAGSGRQLLQSDGPM
jgi:hypothetical protein